MLELLQMTEITFITSNPSKLAHARHICKDFSVNILQYKKFFYGVGYDEPRLSNREDLLKQSIEDAISRWKKYVSNSGSRLFFIEDTSVRIDALSDERNEVPGIDVKYWMQSRSFNDLDKLLKANGNNRKVSVSSHIVLFLTNDLKKKLNTSDDYKVFKSTTHGEVVKEELSFETQILYPWLDNKTFNKWFVPDGFDLPMSMLEISNADKVDFRRNAFKEMLSFLKTNNEIKSVSKKKKVENTIHFNPIFIVSGPTCAGKTSIGNYLLENFNYYHIEASDFMTLKYLETHGTKFQIDKGRFAFEILRINPTVVVNLILDYMISKKIYNNVVITGFRTSNEVLSFSKNFPSDSLKFIYIEADLNQRFLRWQERKRDEVLFTYEKFIEINEIQTEMGLEKIKSLKNTYVYHNNKDRLNLYYEDFNKKTLKEEPIKDNFNFDACINLISSASKISLERSILFSLATIYRKNKTKYYTTTEISKLINDTFPNIRKNKNNVSRYFNQKYYPFYEIKREKGINKYMLSPTGYSEAIFLIRAMYNNII